MKKFLFLFSIFLLLGCDDGDIEFQNSAFQEVELKSCDLVTPTNFYLFKNENDKALILILGLESNNLFKNELTGNTPRTLTIQNNVKLIERIYNRNIVFADICTVLPATNLQVIREWQSVSGSIEVRTTAIKSEPNANGETRILRYRHTIIVRNLTISRDSQLQTFDLFEVGFFDQPAQNFPTINATTINRCGQTNRYILTTDRFVFELNQDSNLFENVDTPVGSPRVALINNNTKFTFRVYNQTLDPLQVCVLDPLTATEIWNAEAGVANVSGLVEVSTTSIKDPDQPTVMIFTHQVKLKKVKMIRSIPNDGLDFLLGNEIVLGNYVVNQ